MFSAGQGLHTAKGGHLSVVRWLVNEAGADPTESDKDGSGVFVWAVMGGVLVDPCGGYFCPHF